MKDSTKQLKESKFFFYRTYFLPEFNRTETLFLSWILSRGIASMNKRMETKERLSKRLDDFKMKPKPIDSGYVSCSTEMIIKRFPFLTDKCIQKMISKLKKEHIIESKIYMENISKEEIPDLIKKRYIRINLLEIQQKSEVTESNIYNYVEYEKRFLSKFGNPHFKIYYDLIDHFESVDSLVFFMWVLNWHIYKKGKESWICVETTHDNLNMGKKGQRSIVKELSANGLLKVEYKNGKNTQFRHLIPIIPKGKKGTRRNPTESPHRNPKVKPRIKIYTKISERNSIASKREIVRPNLFGEVEIPNDTKTIHTEWANVLREAVTQTLKRGFPFSRTKWAKEFKLLEKQTGYATMLIDEVLNWFCRNIKTRYVPVCQSAKTFRLKFDAILQAKERLMDKTVVISPETKDIVTALSRLNWPGTSKTNLNAVVELSVQEYHKWQSILNNFEKLENSTKKSMSGLYMRVRAKFTVNVKTFMKAWFEQVYKRRTYNKNWNGEFSKQDQFSMDNEAFINIGRTVANNYGGRSDVWDVFIKHLTEK